MGKRLPRNLKLGFLKGKEETVEFSGAIVDEEKPYHRLEKFSQNGVDQLVVSFNFFPCEYFLAKC